MNRPERQGYLFGFLRPPILRFFGLFIIFHDTSITLILVCEELVIFIGFVDDDMVHDLMWALVRGSSKDSSWMLQTTLHDKDFGRRVSQYT